MISLLFGIGYGEIMWKITLKRKSSLISLKMHAWFMIVLNFIIAILANSVANLEVSIIIMNYALVIYNLRKLKE